MRTLVQRIGSVKLAGLLVPTIAFVGCPGEEPITLECGAGTELRNGTCVATTTPEDACGPGTLFDEETGTCEPTERCGEGTIVDPERGNCIPVAECGPGTELDLASGGCVPVASCGPGTVLDTTSGECVSEATCGAGTELQDGECVAVGVCAPGSVLNMDTGLCESDTTCGPRQVIVGGQCMSPNDAVGLDADANESTPDLNDPAFGGTPEPLVLEPVGESTVFVGNIGRPADLGDTGVLEQDRDVWSFEGQAGQLLDIEILGTGLPQPAFIVEGPRGYRRSSAILSANDAQREVVLPYTGTYTITVVPTAWVTTQLPVGGTNAGYVGVIEALEHPTPTTIEPSTDQTAPTEVTGNLRGLLDNFLLIDAPVGAAVSLIFNEPSVETPPSVMAFDASGKLITLVDLDLSQGAWVGTLVKDEEGTTVVVDWQSSTATDDAYTLRIAEAPHVQGGTLPPNGVGTTGGATILGESMAAYTVTLPSQVVLDVDIVNTSSPDVQIQNDDGTYAIIQDDDLFFFYGQPSTYTLFVYNDGTAEDEDAKVAYTTTVPLDLGTHDPANPQVTSVSGSLLSPDILGPNTAWAIVSASGAGVLELKPSIQVGEPTIMLFSVGGAELHGYHRPAAQRSLYYVAEAAETVLIQLDGTSMATLEWKIEATTHPTPPVIDIEPNDASSVAIDLGGLPAMGLGTLAPDQSDFYRFTLPEPLEPGQHIEVQVDSLTTGASSFSDSIDIFVFDELDQPVPSSFSFFSDSNNSVYIPASATQSSSSFTVQFAEEFVYEEKPYLIHIRVVDVPMATEPDDTRAEAHAAASLPAEWVAYFDEEDNDANPELPDYFSFTLDADLPPGEVIRIRMLNMGSWNDSDLFLETADGTVIASARNWDAQIVVPGLPAGTYYVSHIGPNNEVPYRLTIEQIPLPVEAEPNDTPEAGTPLGTLAAGAFLGGYGLTTSSDEDWFTFSLDAALDAEEAIAVRIMNVTMDDTGTLDVELWDLSDASNPVLLGAVTDDEGVAVGGSGATGPFGVRIQGNAATADTYHVRIETRNIPAEREPNDLPESAQDLGALAAGGRLYLQGTTSSNDDDYFTFTLDPGVPAEAGVWLTFDNILDTTSMDVELWDVTDSANPVLLSYEYDDFGTLVSAQAGGIYAVLVAGSSSTPDVYELAIETGPAGELEPNDDAATAMALGALPASIHGVISNTGIDVFTVTLDAALGENEVLQVDFDNLDDTTTYDVTLRTTDGTVIVTDDDDLLTLQSDVALAAGTYEIQVDGLDSTSSARVSDLYRLDVQIVDLTPAP